MQTSTSISDLKRTTKQNTDDLVNDILKELQSTPTTPLSTTTEHSDQPEASNSSNSLFASPITSPENTKEQKKILMSTSVAEVLQYLKLPLLIMSLYFILHNNFMNRLFSDYAPDIMKYEHMFMHKLVKSLFMCVVVSLSQYFVF